MVKNADVSIRKRLPTLCSHHPVENIAIPAKTQPCACSLIADLVTIVIR